MKRMKGFPRCRFCLTLRNLFLVGHGYSLVMFVESCNPGSHDLRERSFLPDF